MTWECKETKKCECSRYFEHGSTKVFPSLLGERQDPDRESDEKAVALEWFRLVQLYSGLDLTYEKDRLPALSGIVSRARAVIKEPYVAGTWQDHLPDALLWVPYRSSPDSWRQINDPEPLGRRSRSSPRCPTWSWAAIEGKVAFRFSGLSSYEDSASPVVIHTLSPVRSTDHHGALDLSGPLVPVTIHYYTPEKQMSGLPRSRLRRSSGRDLWEYFVPDLVSDDNTQDSHICNGTELACLHVMSTRTCREEKVFDGVPHKPPIKFEIVKRWITFRGLVLKRVSESDERYERIGYFQRSEYVYEDDRPRNKHIGDDSWFKGAEVKRITLV